MRELFCHQKAAEGSGLGTEGKVAGAEAAEAGPGHAAGTHVKLRCLAVIWQVGSVL